MVTSGTWVEKYYHCRESPERGKTINYGITPKKKWYHQLVQNL